MKAKEKHIDEIYKDWCGESHLTNSCHPVHDSAEAQDFAEYYHKVMEEYKQQPKPIQELIDKYEGEKDKLLNRLQDGGVSKGERISIDTEVVNYMRFIQDLKDIQQPGNPCKLISDEEIEKEADKKMEKTKSLPNPKTTDRELYLGKLAFINGAKWMQDY